MCCNIFANVGVICAASLAADVDVNGRLCGAAAAFYSTIDAITVSLWAAAVSWTSLYGDAAKETRSSGIYAQEHDHGIRVQECQQQP